MDRKLQAIHQTPLNGSDFPAAHGSVAPRWPRQPRAQLFILYGYQLSGWTWHTLPGTVTTVAVSSAIVAIVSGFGEGHLCGSSSLHLGDRKAPGCRSRQLNVTVSKHGGHLLTVKIMRKCWILYELRETQFDKDGFLYMMHLPHLETLVFACFLAPIPRFAEPTLWTHPRSATRQHAMIRSASLVEPM